MSLRSVRQRKKSRKKTGRMVIQKTTSLLIILFLPQSIEDLGELIDGSPPS